MGENEKEIVDANGIYDRTSDEKKETNLNMFIKRLLSPTVIVAIITTLFGSLAVAVVTNYVSKSLGERKLQYEIITTLMRYTKDSKLDKAYEIQKLNALTKLVEDNQQFKVNISGFQSIVDKFYKDELKTTREEKDNLQKQIDDVGNRRSEDKMRLEAKLKEKEEKEGELKSQLSSDSKRKVILEEEITKKNQTIKDIKNEMTTYKTQIRAKENLIIKLTGDIAAKNDIITNLKDKYKIRTLKFDIYTTDATSGIMKILFSNKSPANNLDQLQFENSIVQEFIFPSNSPVKNNGIELKRKIHDLDAIKNARYFCVTKSGGSVWGGKISFYIDDKKFFTRENLQVDDDEPLVEKVENFLK